MSSASPSPPSSPTAPVAQPDMANPSLRILLVEDDPAARDMTLEMLKLLGHWVASVGSAEAARDRYMDGAFDVLMCDVGLPGLSGLELVQSMHTQGVAVLMVSGGARPARLPPACGWLGKPYGLAQLEEALAAVRRPPPGSATRQDGGSNVVPLPTARLTQVRQRQPREGDGGTGAASGSAGGSGVKGAIGATVVAGMGETLGKSAAP